MYVEFEILVATVALSAIYLPAPEPIAVQLLDVKLLKAEELPIATQLPP